MVTCRIDHRKIAVRVDFAEQITDILVSQALIGDEIRGLGGFSSPRHPSATAPPPFRNKEIYVDAVLVSSSLPLAHHAEKIGDGSYWDGGNSANPPLVDLAMASAARDILSSRSRHPGQ
jgi:hypothetical protein